MSYKIVASLFAGYNIFKYLLIYIHIDLTPLTNMLNIDGETHSLKLTSNDKVYRNFMAILFTRAFTRNPFLEDVSPGIWPVVSRLIIQHTTYYNTLTVIAYLSFFKPKILPLTVFPYSQCLSPAKVYLQSLRSLVKSCGLVEVFSVDLKLLEYLHL